MTSTTPEHPPGCEDRRQGEASQPPAAHADDGLEQHRRPEQGNEHQRAQATRDQPSLGLSAAVGRRQPTRAPARRRGGRRPRRPTRSRPATRAGRCRSPGPRPRPARLPDQGAGPGRPPRPCRAAGRSARECGPPARHATAPAPRTRPASARRPRRRPDRPTRSSPTGPAPVEDGHQERGGEHGEERAGQPVPEAGARHQRRVHEHRGPLPRRGMLGQQTLMPPLPVGSA